MAVLSENGRTNLWFGTVERMGWFPTPNRGADVSTEGWEAGGSLLTGGGYQFGSFAAAKNYVFEWPASSSREVATLMKSYSDGSYGRGLIYFQDPLTYDTNVLPALWADPSITIGDEVSAIVPGVKPSVSPTSNPDLWNLPTRSLTFDLTDVGPTYASILDDSNSVFIPIPIGFNLHLGVFGSVSGAGRVYYSVVSRGGGVSGNNPVPVLSNDSPRMFPVGAGISMSPGDVGIRIWVGKLVNSSGSVTISGMHARLAEVGRPAPTNISTWVGGQGHSGVRFSGRPTLINMSGTDGGQVQFAASFREVGSWSVG